MPPDERAEEVGAWLARARQDLRAADVDLGAQPPLTADAAFHCQQAVEKALRAFLVHHDHPFTKTHDIGVLGHVCVEHDPTLEELVRPAAPFTEYAWRFRYPGEEFEPELGEVQDAAHLARSIVQRIASLVNAVAPPA